MRVPATTAVVRAYYITEEIGRKGIAPGFSALFASTWLLLLFYPELATKSEHVSTLNSHIPDWICAYMR